MLDFSLVTTWVMIIVLLISLVGVVWVYLFYEKKPKIDKFNKGGKK